jgi:peptidoglycan/xylan/chitin deacetylase (PgdA/CDA1 family)
MWWLTENALKVLWSTTTLVGQRRLTALLSKKAYGDTTFFFEGEAVQGLVALTIDDGLCRHGAERSMVDAVASLLRTHGAHATFFVCSKYLVGLEHAAQKLVTEGHELGNHMAEDLNFVYPKMKPEAFDTALGAATSAIEAAAPGVKLRWFRAPQGIMTSTMAESVRQHGLKSALGDAYADDWAMAHNAAFVARTILQQATSGSIIILHQPEVGYREHTLTILQRVLEGLTAKGMRAVTLSEMEALATSANAAGGTATKARKSSTKRSVVGRFLVREVDISGSQVRSEAETGGGARI